MNVSEESMNQREGILLENLNMNINNKCNRL